MCELQLVQLGQAIDQLGHRRAKALHQVGLGHAAVFHGVVQQCRHQCLGIKLPCGALRRHSNRVRDVGLAAVAHLAQVRGVGKAIGAAHQLDIVGRQVIQLAFKHRKAGGGRIGGGQWLFQRGHDRTHSPRI